MRILLVNEARRGAGGVESYLAALVRVLERRGHAVALLFANSASEDGPTAVAASETWSVADEGLAAALAHAARWAPDVAFSHNLRPLEIDAAVASRWPLVKMMHGYFGTCVSGQKTTAFPSMQPCSRTCGAACLLHYLPRRCGTLRPGAMLSGYAWSRRQQDLFSAYRAVVVASEHMRREYARHGIPHERLHAIPLFGPPPSRVQGHSACDVLFLGRMTPLKGADLLLDACADAAGRLGRDVRLVAAGAGPLQESLRRPVRGVHAELPGWVSEQRRAELFAGATLVAMPSRWPEPFGLVGLEAAAAGVPAVAFDVGGISTWLRSGDNGVLVDPSAGGAGFGEALATVLGSAGVRARLSTGASAAARRFSSDAHADALEPVLAAACGRPVTEPLEIAR